jgi:hypothetical protein
VVSAAVLEIINGPDLTSEDDEEDGDYNTEDEKEDDEEGEEGEEDSDISLDGFIDLNYGLDDDMDSIGFCGLMEAPLFMPADGEREMARYLELRPNLRAGAITRLRAHFEKVQEIQPPEFRRQVYRNGPDGLGEFLADFEKGFEPGGRRAPSRITMTDEHWVRGIWS